VEAQQKLLDGLLAQVLPCASRKTLFGAALTAIKILS
jgi:hypothetical protein